MAHVISDDCVKCGACESVCPQHIAIREELEKAAKALKSSLAYRVGLLLTWPLRKAWNAVRRS